MKHLKPSPSTVHFGFYDGSLKPVLEVESGQEIILDSLSANLDDDVPPEWIPKVAREVHERAPRGAGPHAMTGPVAVRGAKPGDVLQVDIRDIRLTQPYGYNEMIPLKGMFPAETPVHRRTIIPIDLKSGLAEVAPGVKIPTRPFFGQLAVAPPPSWGKIDTRPPNKFGGNLDNKELTPGARLFLPVWADGALFSAGDGHAAQGDGEINQTAIETSLRGRFRLTIRRDVKSALPFAVLPSQIMTMGFDESLDQAARIAARSMIRILEEYYGMKFDDAYRLCSLAADLRVTQFVNGLRGIHVMLPVAPLASLPSQGPFFDGVDSIIAPLDDE
jgi:acetamidase/formamidase